MPSNAGNIIRLSVNCGARLHFVGPLGFYLDNERLMRAGLDYHELCNLTVHVNFQQFLEKEKPKRLIASTSKAHHSHVSFKFEDGNVKECYYTCRDNTYYYTLADNQQYVYECPKGKVEKNGKCFEKSLFDDFSYTYLHFPSMHLPHSRGSMHR